VFLAYLTNNASLPPLNLAQRIHTSLFHSLSSFHAHQNTTATSPLPWSAPPEVDIFSLKENRIVERRKLHPFVFAAPLRTDVLHQAVVWYRASQRQGTHQAKTVGMVAHSTKKLRRQKGSGMARLGNRRAPQLRGGGVVFPPMPRDYSFSLPEKVRRLALRTALSAKLAEGRLIFLAEDSIDSHKTKDFENLLYDRGLLWEETNRHSKKPATLLMCVPGAIDENLRRASRNIENISLVPSGGLNVFEILRHTTLALCGSTVDILTTRLLKDHFPSYHEFHSQNSHNLDGHHSAA